MGALTEITKEASDNGGGNILLVVHGGILRNIFNQLDKSIDVSGIENASISKVEYENGEYKVITTNDMSYKIKGEKIKEEFSN
jgi:probable phosphoglycerate mutase